LDAVKSDSLKRPSAVERLASEYGFSLVEVAIVLVVLGLIAAATIPFITGILTYEHRSDTASRIAAVDAAIVNFVTQNRRLPCPADGTIATGAANSGVEARNAAGDCTAINSGVVPWATLGITEPTGQDGWNQRLMYRVTTGATGLTRAFAVDLSACDPVGTGVATTTVAAGLVVANPAPACLQRPPCASGAAANCTSPANYLTGAGRGLQIRNAAGTILMDPAAGTGAAYIIVSSADNMAGSYTTAGALLAGTPPVGTGETTNANGQALQAFYTDTTQFLATVPANSHFDDIVSRPSIMAVAAKASVGPRGF